MPNDDNVLIAAWLRWLPGGPEQPDAAHAVIDRYREPHRRYHGVQHLACVVRDVGILLGEVAVTDPATVVAAAFFHDAIYEPRSSTNEADSAALAASTLAAWESHGWTPSRRDEVVRLILATAGHVAGAGADDPSAAVLLDADLAVLGADPAAYHAYVLAVRAEYAHVDDAGWRLGRAAVLRSFLTRPTIFQTPSMLRREPSARANLSAELAPLAAAST